MKKHSLNTQKSGFTLIELSVIISVILILVSTVTFGIGAYRDWQNGLAGTEALKSIYQAQRLFLADNPTTPVGSVTATNISNNLSNNITIQTVSGSANLIKIVNITNSNGGDGFTVDVSQSPPVITIPADPKSGDGLWEIN